VPRPEAKTAMLSTSLTRLQNQKAVKCKDYLDDCQ
jgi:hypothetical protein